MKKVIIGIIGLIVLLWLIFFIKDIPKYRFGYFVEGPELKYEHRDADVLKLENGNVLILGQNAHSCPTPEACKDNIMPVVEVPSEIYNAKTNKIEELRLPNNIRYQAKGILLKNNRLLLTQAHVTSKNKIHYSESLNPYNVMLIINIKTMQVEKIIEKKNASSFTSNFTLLDENNLLVVDLLNKIWEIYNLNTGESRFLENINIDCQTIIPKEQGKALIFNHTGNVYEYNNKNKEIKIVGNVFKRGFAIIKKINDNELLIIGGTIDNAKNKRLPIEIYNMKTNESKIITNMPDNRAYSINRGNTFSGILLNNKYFLIAGGDANNYPFETPLNNLLILDLSNYTIRSGPKLPYNITAPAMFKMSNNTVSIIGNKSDYNNKKILLFIWKEN